LFFYVDRRSRVRENLENSFIFKHGYLPAGNNVEVPKKINLDQAKVACDPNPNCKGFTTKDYSTNPTWFWLKNKADQVYDLQDNPGWKTWVKTTPVEERPDRTIVMQERPYRNIVMQERQAHLG